MRSISILKTGTASLAMSLVLVASPVFAQNAAAQEDEESATEEQTPEAAPGGIIVSGTRLRVPNLTSPEPITTLSSQQLRERNFTNIADALNELPGNRGSVTPAGGQGFGQGTNFINNYGLGSNRTLTLVNGRRFVSSNVATIFTNAAAGTQVDLNVIPSILVDRIDAISVGGAPLYGSDAISGTINVVLRSKFDGVDMQGTMGISEEGDNQTYNLSGLFGKSFMDDRLNLTFSVSHDNVEGLVYNDREFLRRRIGGATNPTSAQAVSLRPGVVSTPLNDGRLNPAFGFNNSLTDGNPGTVLIRGVNIPYLTPGGLITGTNLAGADPLNPAVRFGFATNNGLQFAPNGNLVPFNQGIVFPGTSGSGGDGFRFSDYTQITSDLKRTTLNGFITFEVAPSIELFAEGTYFKSRADELVQQPTFNSSLFGGLSGALTYSVNNPFLTAQARDALVSRGVTQFQVSRSSDDFADLTGFNKTNIYYGTGGIRGDFSLFGNAWNFEAFASHGRTRSRDFGQDVNAQNFINATNVALVNGQIVCTTAQTRTGGFAAPGGTPIADPNCQPLNVFGRGVASQAALDYIIEDFVTTSTQEQTVYNANFGGGLFDLWGAGPLALNIGYEHRDEAASFIPSDFQQAGRGRSVAIVPVTGKYNLDEVFGEAVLPLISPDNNFFLHSAQLFGRGRYSDNSINGGQFSYTVGGTIAPVEDIQFRGNYTQSFRSPGITELFLPQVNTFATVPDLCQDAAIGLGAVPDIRRRNCTAFRNAFPNTNFAVPDPASQATVPARSGGNPNLENERATSFTYGVIFQPRFIPRLAITADYVSIRLKGPISSLTVPTIVSGCFDNENFNTDDVLNANSFCSQIRRDPTTGRVLGDPQNPAVSSGFVNGQEIKFSGIQGTIGYSIPMTDLGLDGTLSFGGDMLYVRRRLVNITGVAPARSDGTIGDPEFSGQLRIRYVERDFGINTTINYTGEQLFSRLNREIGQSGQGFDAREIDQLNDYVTVNGSIFFDPTDNFRLTLAVNNLFNRQGQKYQGELIPASFTDLIGRRFSVSANVRF
ncbi:TonB-dependent receptor [Erythrobacter neustonensis]|uniref:TonB-dependent receptor n=2 Tax=Erythrobacter neustonensis TaxID=1112 RepID=A0A192D4M8_9SPHN|nr:TonB-dependent receptor [Erythrobacter neustonensis]